MVKEKIIIRVEFSDNGKIHYCYYKRDINSNARGGNGDSLDYSVYLSSSSCITGRKPIIYLTFSATHVLGDVFLNTCVETKDAPSLLNQAAELSRVSSRGNPHPASRPLAK